MVTIQCFVNVAKMAVAIAYYTVYLHTSEIFPDVIRATALGLTITVGWLGGIGSPFASVYLVRAGKDKT